MLQVAKLKLKLVYFLVTYNWCGISTFQFCFLSGFQKVNIKTLTNALHRLTLESTGSCMILTLMSTFCISLEAGLQEAGLVLGRHEIEIDLDLKFI